MKYLSQVPGQEVKDMRTCSSYFARGCLRFCSQVVLVSSLVLGEGCFRALFRKQFLPFKLVSNGVFANVRKNWSETG